MRTTMRLRRVAAQSWPKNPRSIVLRGAARQKSTASTTTAAAMCSRRSDLLDPLISRVYRNSSTAPSWRPRHVRSLSTEPADTSSSSSRSTTASSVSREDVRVEERNRQRLSDVRISKVLQAKHSIRWIHPVIRQDATVKEAIQHSIEGGLSAMMVLSSSDDHVVGLLSSRDLLRILAQGFADGNDAASLQRHVGDFMTPIGQVIYARPDETVGVCRALMAKLGIKCLPILNDDGLVEGLITARDMSDYGLSATEKGGKTAYLKDVSNRVGLSSDTSMAEPPPFLKAHLALEQSPLFANVGTAALPHPHKSPSRDYDNDIDLSEDAHFVRHVRLPDSGDEHHDLRPFTYVGVADGVGSWRDYGVDPRIFARRLMAECDNVLLEAARNEAYDGRNFRHVSSPAQVMAQAYERVKNENVVGSSTACVALLDGLRHQLHFSNLGDSGLILLRHIDSDVAGSLKRERNIPRSERTSDLRLAFVSQQQLHAFNHPFQLGWAGGQEDQIQNDSVSFKQPESACTTSIHVRRGDIVIVATDGLFDNVDEEDICNIALEWEQSQGFMRDGDIGARDKRWSTGNSMTNVSASSISELADRLCKKAREKSLDQTVDSPFAILAKENDIMWSGGMPDDCTVIAMHVVGQDANDCI